MSYRDPTYNSVRLNEKGGTEAEGDIIGSLQSIIPSEYLIRCSNTDEDKYEGTDLIVGKRNDPENQIRIDITSRFSNKDNMPYVHKTDIYAANGQNFQIGIRYGNKFKGHTDFKTPVVVIGFDMTAREYREHDNDVNSSIRKHYKELLKEAMGCLKNYTVTDPEKRKKVYKTPLERNVCFYQHSYTNAKYKELNDASRELNHVDNSEAVDIDVC